MGYFDEQIRQKEENDDRRFEDAFIGLASAVMGSQIAVSGDNRDFQIRNAFDDILQYYHVEKFKLPDNLDSFDHQLDSFISLSGLMKRTVKLTDRWYRNAIGPFLAFFRDSDGVVTLMPDRNGYSYRDYATGNRIKITKENAGQFRTEAYCFYKPFPSVKMTKKDLLRYSQKTTSGKSCWC